MCFNCAGMTQVVLLKPAVHWCTSDIRVPRTLWLHKMIPFRSPRWYAHSSRAATKFTVRAGDRLDKVCIIISSTGRHKKPRTAQRQLAMRLRSKCKICVCSHLAKRKQRRGLRKRDHKSGRNTHQCSQSRLQRSIVRQIANTRSL